MCMSTQAKKRTSLVDKQVCELCQKMQLGLKDGSVSTRQAGQWIFEQSKVSQTVCPAPSLHTHTILLLVLYECLVC